MSSIDIFWIVMWFFAGLIVFETRGESKHIITLIGGIFSAISLISIFSDHSSPDTILLSIGLSRVAGTLTFLSYLIGANISRCNRFGSMSPRIILYIILFILLWFILSGISQLRTITYHSVTLSQASLIINNSSSVMFNHS